MHGGWTPAVHLYSQARGKLRFDEAIDAFVPGSEVPGFRSTGAARGERLTRFAPIRQPSGQGFVDFQNDVTAKDIALALREGFESIEHVKRYTTTGMATDQGKTSNMSVLGIVADTLKRPVPQVGHHHLPHAVHAGDLRRADRRAPRSALRRGARDALPRLGQRARRAVRGRRPVETRARIPAGRRRPARRGAARMPHRAHHRRAVRRLDARQDRGRRPRRARIPESHVRERLLHASRLAASRYALMLREDGYVYDDGIVALPRARALPRHHHDRRRGARARLYGGLPADRVERSAGVPHLHHRAVRRDRGARTEGGASGPGAERI